MITHGYRGADSGDPLPGTRPYDRQTLNEWRIGEATARGEIAVAYQFKYTKGMLYFDRQTSVVGMKRMHDPALAHAPALRDMEHVWNLTSPVVDFVLATYRDRRPHWTPEFLGKLRKLARDWLENSIYIVNEDIDYTTHQRTIRGTIRLIVERNGLLPMEEYLGVRLPTVQGELKVEPGNLAIQKDLNEEVWPEVLSHLLGAIVTRTDDGKDNHYYTYADDYSLKLYRMLGYKTVPIDKLELLPNTEIRNGKILKQGVEWTVMEASQETLNRLYEIYAARKKSRDGVANRADGLAQRMAMINDNQNSRNRYVLGVDRATDTPSPLAIHISHWQANVAQPASIQIDFQQGGIENVQKVSLPARLPLTDGQWTAPDGRTTTQYKDGVLTSTTIDESPGYSARFTMSVRISADLRTVHSLYFEHWQNGRLRRRVDGIF